MANENEIWQMALKELSDLLQFSEISMNLWFGSIQMKILTETTAYLQINDDFKKSIVDSKYLSDIREALRRVLGFPVEPQLISTEKSTFEDQLAELLCDDRSKPEKQDYHYVMRSDGFKEIDSDLLMAQAEKTEDPQALDPDDPFPLSQPVSTSPDASPAVTYSTVGHSDPGEPSNAASTAPSLTERTGTLLISRSSPNLSPAYSFDNFVVGNSNRFAYAASLSVAHSPATQYNPLFLYGQPGLGKTHLLYAVTREIAVQFPDFNIIYVKGEDFTNELIESITRKVPVQFREKYRNADVLLVDDIQFIAGKVAIQEEFFHTFDALFESGKQIIVTSDRPPRDIKTLEERLRSRFEYGLIADIQPPDLELRIAIFKQKAHALGIVVPNDVLLFLGENIKDNIRQIEGVIKKMRALAFIKGDQITIDLAKKVVSDILSTPTVPTLTPERIIQYVATKFDVAQEDIVGKKRSKDIVRPRHISIYLIRSLLDTSYPSIGRIFNRDHTTIMASIENMEREIKSSASFEAQIEEYKKEIKEMGVSA